MAHNRKIASKLTFGLILITSLFFFGGNAIAQAQAGNAINGQALIKANCAQCHSMEKKATGPALMGAYDRWKKNDAKLHDWIQHNPGVLASSDAFGVYANSLFN